MFGFKNKVDLRQEATTKVNDNAHHITPAEIEAWCASEEHKRFVHLETLIIKAYGTIGITADTLCGVLSDEFTRADLIQDFAVFFDSKVFDKLKDWCKEYEILRKLHSKVFFGEE